MNRDHIRAFESRDWTALEDEKTRFWIEQKRGMTAAEALAAGEALRRYARCVKPGWPDPAEQDADLAVHVRVTEALGAVSRHCSR
jgi:hypothetical protein